MFVASILSQSDHNYSLIVRNEPEVEVETVVETTTPYRSHETEEVSTNNSPGHELIGLFNNINGIEPTSYISPVLDNVETYSMDKSGELHVSPKKSFRISPSQQLQSAKPLGKHSPSSPNYPNGVGDNLLHCT